jgi:hypothetical protein
MLERTSALVGNLLPASEDHQHSAFRTELDDHIRTFIRDPDVVLLIDFYGMSKAPCVQTMADLPNVFSIGVELEQLRCRCSIGGSGRAATREDENVPFGVDRHASASPKYRSGGSLKKSV